MTTDSPDQRNMMRSNVILSVALVSLLLVGGCVGGLPLSDSSDSSSTCPPRDNGSGGADNHALLIVSEQRQEPYKEPVPISNRTLQCTEPIVTTIEQWQQGERPAQDSIEGSRYNATREAFSQFEYDPLLGIPVQLDDGTVLLVDTAANGSSSG